VQVAMGCVSGLPDAREISGERQTPTTNWLLSPNLGGNGRFALAHRGFSSVGQVGVGFDGLFLPLYPNKNGTVSGPDLP